MTTTIAQALKEVFFAFEGRPVWGGTHSHGSHFMLEFGERIGRVILKSGRAATFGEGSFLVLGPAPAQRALLSLDAGRQTRPRALIHSRLYRS